MSLQNKGVEKKIFLDALSARMTAAQEKSGLRRSAVADRIGIKRAHMSGCLKGRSFPSVQVLAAFARVVGVSADSLLFGESPPAQSRTASPPMPIAFEVGAPFEPGTAPRLALVALSDGRQLRGVVSAGEGGEVKIAPYPVGTPFAVSQRDVIHCFPLIIKG